MASENTTFNISYLNIRGILGHARSISSFLLNLKTNIFAVTETWLTPLTLDKIKLAGYVLASYSLRANNPRFHNRSEGDGTAIFDRLKTQDQILKHIGVRGKFGI